jgi:hypothetical protein
VGAYPIKTPNTVIGIRNLEMRLVILLNRYRIKVSPSTQPTWGRALKTIIIETVNPQITKNDNLFFNWKIMNKQAKVAITQNSVALSFNPKTDQTKWLGIKENIKKKVKKILWFCLNRVEMPLIY